MAKKQRQMRSQKISDKVLEQMLGKETQRRPSKPTKSGKPGKGREVMKKSLVKEGRKSPGQKNPRGGYTGRSLEEQVTAPVGGLPQPSPQDMIMQIMGMGGGEPAYVNPVDSPRGYYNNETPLHPDYATGRGYAPSMAQDPAYQAAAVEWMRMKGREPMTDSDLAEVDSMMQSGDVSRQATEQEILKNVTGTRPAQGPISDDSQLPDSDRSYKPEYGKAGDTPYVREEAIAEIVADPAAYGLPPDATQEEIEDFTDDELIEIWNSL